MNVRRRALVAATAAALGALFGVPGVGHAYLRKWRRAVAWFAVVVGAILVIALTVVDPATLEALAATDPLSASIADFPEVIVVPYYVLLSLSILDAYVVARRADARRQLSDAETCPNCGRELDAGISFCWYCSEPLSE